MFAEALCYETERPNSDSVTANFTYVDHCEKYCWRRKRDFFLRFYVKNQLNCQFCTYLRRPGCVVVFDELRGGTCILGRRFHLVGSSEGDAFQVERAPCCGFGTQGRHSYLRAPFSCSESLGGKLRGRHFFKFWDRPVVVAELRGGICILGRRFHLVGSSEGGIFQV